MNESERSKESNISKWISEKIKKYVNSSPQNILGGKYNEKAWGEALVGFSMGDDSLYYKIKEDIGDFYWTPIEIFLRTYPESKAMPGELAIICWALPQTELTKADMRQEKYYPAERATLSRINGDIFNKNVGKYVVELLNKSGYEAVAPIQSPFWENKKSEKYGFASNWSERHAAFISGLGTFSLTDTLITSVGTAVRIGSVVARISIDPTKRNYDRYNEYCLYYSNIHCKKCIERCPASAISINGHDKNKCLEYQREVTGKYIKQHYNIDSRYCGLCQFNVPCESCIPLKSKA